jgi:hypothetical protein
LFCGAELPSTAGRTGRPPSYCDDYCQQAALLDRIRPDGEADLAPAREQVLELMEAIAALGAKLQAIEERLPERRRQSADPYAEAYRDLARAVRLLVKRSGAAPAGRAGKSAPAGTPKTASSMSATTSRTSAKPKTQR